MRAGLVEKDGATKRYFLGEGAFVLGILAARRHGLLDLCLPGLRRLSQASLDTSFLTIRRDDHAVCLHREEGTYPVRTHALQAGDRHPLGIGAGSLAILAALPEREAEAVVAGHAGRMERYPLFSGEALRRTSPRPAAEATRSIPAGSWGMGVAFFYPDGRVAGAPSLAAIDGRM